MLVELVYLNLDTYFGWHLWWFGPTFFLFFVMYNNRLKRQKECRANMIDWIFIDEY